GLEARSTASAAARSPPWAAVSAMAYAAATPIAGAPRTTIVRIASATSDALVQRTSSTASGSRRWSSSTTASGSSRTICSGSSTPVTASRRPKPPRRRCTRTRRSRAFVPRREVLRLLVGEPVDLDAHRLELEPRDLLVDLLRHRIHLLLQARRVLHGVL